MEAYCQNDVNYTNTHVATINYASYYYSEWQDAMSCKVLQAAEIQLRMVCGEIGVQTSNNTTIKGMDIFVFFGNIQKNVGYLKNNSNFVNIICFSYIPNNNLPFR